MSSRHIWTGRDVRKFLRSGALKSLTPAARLIYLTLHTYSDTTGKPVWPSAATLAADSGMHEDTARDVLKDLQRIGAIRIEYRTGQSNLIHFRTTIREPLGESPPPGSETPPGVTDPTPLGSETLPPLGSETPPKNQRRNKKKKGSGAEVVEIKGTSFNVDLTTGKETSGPSISEGDLSAETFTEGGRKYRIRDHGGIKYREYLEWKKA